MDCHWWVLINAQMVLARGYQSIIPYPLGLVSPRFILLSESIGLRVHIGALFSFLSSPTVGHKLRAPHGVKVSCYIFLVYIKTIGFRGSIQKFIQTGCFTGFLLICYYLLFFQGWLFRLRCWTWMGSTTCWWCWRHEPEPTWWFGYLDDHPI